MKKGTYAGELCIKKEKLEDFVFPITYYEYHDVCKKVSNALQINPPFTPHSGKLSHIVRVLDKTVSNGTSFEEAQAMLLYSTGSRSEKVNTLQGYFKKLLAPVISDQTLLFNNIKEKIKDGNAYRLQMYKGKNFKSISFADVLKLLRDPNKIDGKETPRYLPNEFTQFLKKTDQSIFSYYMDHYEEILLLDEKAKKIKTVFESHQKEEKQRIFVYVAPFSVWHWLLACHLVLLDEIFQINQFIKKVPLESLILSVKKPVDVLKAFESYCNSLDITYEAKKKKNDPYIEVREEDEITQSDDSEESDKDEEDESNLVHIIQSKIPKETETDDYLDQKKILLDKINKFISENPYFQNNDIIDYFIGNSNKLDKAKFREKSTFNNIINHIKDFKKIYQKIDRSEGFIFFDIFSLNLEMFSKVSNINLYEFCLDQDLILNDIRDFIFKDLCNELTGLDRCKNIFE